nr:hypothetical protein [uncultured Campylobacter sp.]
MFFGFIVAKFVGFRSRNLISSVGDICVLNLTARILESNLDYKI